MRLLQNYEFFLILFLSITGIKYRALRRAAANRSIPVGRRFWLKNAQKTKFPLTDQGENGKLNCYD